MNDDTIAAGAYGFGDGFVLTTRPLRLERGGRNVSLRNRALRLLALLVARDGALVSQDDIKAALWPDREVDVARGVHVCIGEIRQALGDDPESPQFIETIPRQGYRFIAGAHPLAAPADQKAQAVDAVQQRARLPVRNIAATLALAAIAVGVFAILQVQPQKPDPVISIAQESYDKGRYLLDLGGPENVERSASFFAEAIGRDSKFAPAYFALAEISILRGDMKAARAQAEKGAAADPASPLPHLYFARAALWDEWNWEKAERELKIFLRDDPDSGKGHMLLGWLAIIRGDSDTALKEAQLAYRLDPVSALVRSGYGEIHYYTGDFETAFKFCGESDALTAAFRSGDCLLSSSLALQSWSDAAKIAAQLAETSLNDPALAERMRSMPNQAAVDAFFEALGEYAQTRSPSYRPMYAGLYKFMVSHDAEDALAALNAGFAAHYSTFPILVRDPVFAPLHGRKEFNEILLALGLEPYPEAPEKLTEKK